MIFLIVTVTNDTTTILWFDDWNLLEVYAKALCDMAPLQDEKVGDGTTSLIILTAEMQ